MNPYVSEGLAKEHRDDLLRAAERPRLARSAEIKPRNRVRWWSSLLRGARIYELADKELSTATSGNVAGAP